MKNLAILLLLLALPAAACKHHSGVKGNGNRQIQKRDVGQFTSIRTEGAFTVQVVAQQDVSLVVEGDENILPLITTNVSGSELQLRNTQDYSASEPIIVKISVPNVEELSVSGAGHFDIKGLKNDKFSISANGAPVINVAGVTKELSIDTNGAAKIDTHNLAASRGVVDSKGVSSVEVDVKDQLDVKVSGPSTITYKGNPTINQTVNGPGRVVKRASEGA